MKVIFTHGYFLAEDEKEQKIMRPYPPLGILYLSAWLEKQGVDNEVLDTTFSNKTAIKTRLKKEQADIIAIYTNLMTKLNTIELVKFIKKEMPKTLIVFGGPDVTYNVENYLATGAHIVVIGEGEQTMLEITQSLEKGNRSEFGHIDGLAYYSKGGQLIQTPPRKRVRPVDSLPFPNRHKIDMQQYLKIWKKYHGKSAMTLSTQRGCPYTCKWCSTAVYGQSYRRRSPSLVVDELVAIKATYNPDTIWFVDDVFTVSHQWLKAFRDEIVERNVSISFECITRADRMNEQVIQWLKEAGAFRVWIGAESGSQRIVDAMDRRVKVEQVKEMIQKTKLANIQTGTFIMLGYPSETETDIFATVDYLKAANPDFFTITIAYPIKGTSLYQEVESSFTKLKDWNKSTDRDIDFKRTYQRKYYDYAISWVNSEVQWNKYRLEKNWLNFKALKTKFKSILMRALMAYAK